MESAGVELVYAFVVSWNEVSRGVFFEEYFANLETCMTYLQSWTYDANQVNVKCIQIKPN